MMTPQELREATARAVHRKRYPHLDDEFMERSFIAFNRGILVHNASVQDAYEVADAALALIGKACAEVAASWRQPSNIKLAAGEMTAQELRTAQAVAAGIETVILTLTGAAPDA
jgi:hypothetical protein